MIVRGVERRDIFLDDDDRQSFLDRFSSLLIQTGTECLAWSFLTNHAHMLLRPTQGKLGHLMRRLLTGYAVTFNLRHHRSGHLFQNRYKSIICEEDPYLLELVRYIHLNPLRAGIVKDTVELNEYPWSGHAVLMGRREMPGQNVEEVLRYFGQRKKLAQEKYQSFVADGITLGRREELVGGGLKRVLKLVGGELITAYDDRILGRAEFVEQLKQEKEVSERLDLRMPLAQLVTLVAEVADVEPEALGQRRRGALISDAKSIICYLAARRIGYSGETVAKALGITRSGVCRGASRGAALLAQNSGKWGGVEEQINKSTTSP
ncbi:transposase [Geotalea uraniireducens]|uniref:transposase n=1 Tax=Geotalea uraniireducens TaxID=351604 RepID=UPI00030622E7|nr:transposase [Geotalea uraniireducens]